MAKAISNRANMFLSIAMVLSVLLVIAVAQGRSTLGIGSFQSLKSSTLACADVIGVKSGDTCDAIIKTYHLNPKSFGSANPNLNCDGLFVGQWLCVED